MMKVHNPKVVKVRRDCFIQDEILIMGVDQDEPSPYYLQKPVNILWLRSRMFI